jgi:hypothetical protein
MKIALLKEPVCCISRTLASDFVPGGRIKVTLVFDEEGE